MAGIGVRSWVGEDCGLRIAGWKLGRKAVPGLRGRPSARGMGMGLTCILDAGFAPCIPPIILSALHYPQSEIRHLPDTQP